MKQLRIDPPNEKQKLFLQAECKHVGFGGARGGGKSWCVRVKAVLLCMKYAGIKTLIVRRTYPELLNNHINPLLVQLHGVAKYHKTEKVFTFPNGSTIAFGYCNADRDLGRYQGAEYDVIFLDEATQLREDWIRRITASVRGVNAFPKRVYYTCNPGGPSHGYFKRLFIDRRFLAGENPEDYVFIQSLVTDNAALSDFRRDNGNPDDGSELDEVLVGAVFHGRMKDTETNFWSSVRYFGRHEFACRCGGKYCNGYPVEPSEQLVRILDEIRDRVGRPVYINSGIRCSRHNASPDVGGASDSRHLYGDAADIRCPGVAPRTLYEIACDLVGDSGGVGLYSWGIHVDTRGCRARWNG